MFGRCHGIETSGRIDAYVIRWFGRFRRANPQPPLPRPLRSLVMTDEQFKTLVRELRIIQIGIAVMIVILVFIAGWLQP
jgi:hypothetical protein